MATPAPTAGEFKAEYPEFAGAPQGLVEGKLRDAARLTNASLLGDNTAAAVKLRAALLLFDSPFARGMRKEYEPVVKAYANSLRQIQNVATCGLRVF